MCDEMIGKKPDEPGSRGKKHGKHKVGVCRFVPGEGAYRYQLLPPPAAAQAIRKGGHFAPNGPIDCEEASAAVVEDEE